MGMAKKPPTELQQQLMCRDDGPCDHGRIRRKRHLRSLCFLLEGRRLESSRAAHSNPPHKP